MKDAWRSTFFSVASAARRPLLARRCWTIRTRLVVSCLLMLTVFLVFLSLMVRLAVRVAMMNSIERRLRLEARSRFLPAYRSRDRLGFYDTYEADAPSQTQESGTADTDSDAPGKSGTIYVARHFDLDGNPLEVRPLLDAKAFQTARLGRDRFSTVTIAGETVQVLTVPSRQGGQIVGFVQAGYPLTEVRQVLRIVDAGLLLLVPITLLVAGVSGVYLTSRVLYTVHETTRAAERIGFRSETDLSERLPVFGDDEFARLAATFNVLLGRVERTVNEQKRLVEQQRRFTADASHELKTPLTVIRGMTGLALGSGGSGAAGIADTTNIANIEPRHALERIDAASARMAHLVQDLLLLARTDSGQAAEEQVELMVHEILNRAARRTLELSPNATLRIDVSDSTLVVCGTENELVRVFSNLLDNAVRYSVSPAADSATIVMRARREGNEAVVQVADNGVGIAPEHLPHLGERFYRAEPSRVRSEGGTGLGLSICRSIVAAHGGTIGFESVLSVGTTVTVRLPIEEVEGRPFDAGGLSADSLSEFAG